MSRPGRREAALLCGSLSGSCQSWVGAGVWSPFPLPTCICPQSDQALWPGCTRESVRSWLPSGSRDPGLRVPFAVHTSGWVEGWDSVVLVPGAVEEARALSMVVQGVVHLSGDHQAVQQNAQLAGHGDTSLGLSRLPTTLLESCSKALQVGVLSARTGDVGRGRDEQSSQPAVTSLADPELRILVLSCEPWTPARRRRPHLASASSERGPRWWLRSRGR